jgi:putative DNA primase/helicase
MTVSQVVRKDSVASRAVGNWHWILKNLAPTLADAIAAWEQRKFSKHVDCPNHSGPDGRKDFRCLEDFDQTGGVICTCGAHRGFDTLMWVNGWSFKDALYAVAKEVGMVGNVVAPLIQPKPPVVDVVAVQRRARAARLGLQRVWNESLALSDPGAQAVHAYLASRGLSVPPTPHLRCHPSLEYFDEDGILLGSFPAMVAAIVGPDGESISLHRTYLSTDGRKAPVPTERKQMETPADTTCDGAAIRLFPLKGATVLGVAEGIETALAAGALFRVPVWAAINTSLMKKFVPPQGIKKLIVFADKDRPRLDSADGAGIEAAKVLRERLAASGLSVEIKVPPMAIPEGKKGVDWADVLVASQQRMTLQQTA